MSTRMYLTEEAAKRVVTKTIPPSKGSGEHVRHILDDEFVYLERGQFYFDDYKDVGMLSASPAFLKNIARVTTTYSGPRGSRMREFGLYKTEGAEAYVEPLECGGNKDWYNSYKVILTAKSLDGAKSLLNKIIEGNIRPVIAMHGTQSGVPTENAKEIIGEQQRIIGELKGDLDHAMKVIAEFNVVYVDYQRIVAEQRAVINAAREQLTA